MSKYSLRRTSSWARSRSLPPKIWKTPEEAAAEIFKTITTRDLGPEHAEVLSEALGEQVFPYMEPEDVLDVASRLAQLPNMTEVAAAVTLILRVAPLPLLCRVWREAVSGAPLLGRAPKARAKLREVSAETQQALVEALEQDQYVSAQNATQALAEAAAEDRIAMAAEEETALKEVSE